MAVPQITWKRFLSTADYTGTTVTALSLGSMTAGSWSANKCYGVYVTNNDISDVKIWVGSSVVTFTPSDTGSSSIELSLCTTGAIWDFRGRVVSTVAGQASLFAGSGGAMSSGDQMATPYLSAGCPINSAGYDRNTKTSGFNLGRGSNSYISAGTYSNPIFISVKAPTNSYNGRYSGILIRLEYNFS